MTYYKFQKILNSNRKLSVEELLEILYEIGDDCLEELLKYNDYQRGSAYYSGELNMITIFVKLLEKVNRIKKEEQEDLK